MIIRILGDEYEVDGDIVRVPIYNSLDLVSVPDLNWSKVDSAGHKHQWVDVDGEISLPTLVMPAYEDEGGLSHYVCKECGEIVLPGWKEEPKPDARPAVLKYLISVDVKHHISMDAIALDVLDPIYLPKCHISVLTADFHVTRIEAVGYVNLKVANI